MGHQLYQEAAPFWSCWSRWTCFFFSQTCRRATHHYIKRRKSLKWTKLQCPKGRKQKLDPKISSQTLMLHPLLMLKEKEEVEAKQQASLFGMQHDYSCRNWGGGSWERSYIPWTFLLCILFLVIICQCLFTTFFFCIGKIS